MNEDNDSLNVGDSVYVHWTNIDGMCGDGIYGFGEIVSVDNCRNQVTVNMRDQNFPSFYRDYTIPIHSVRKED